MMAAVLESVIFLVQESSQLEFETFLQPHTRYNFTIASSRTQLIFCKTSVQWTQDSASKCDPFGTIANIFRENKQDGA